MVHAVMLADGEVVSYCNHWLQTPRFLHEKHAGQNIYPRVRLSYTFPLSLYCSSSMHACRPVLDSNTDTRVSGRLAGEVDR